VHYLDRVRLPALADLHMPSMTAIEAIEKIRAEFPDAQRDWTGLDRRLRLCAARYGPDCSIPRRPSL
jgi:CheY-like chemotaxis protein